MIETRLLHYFLAVARYGNITRAAESLYISQATLSKQMIDLEKQLGKPLFIRGKRQITLTSEGIFLRNRANDILALMESTESAFSSKDDPLSGNLVIGTAETYGMAFLAEILTDFQKQHPKVTYQFVSADADMIQEQIDKGVIEMAILMAVNFNQNYEYLNLDYTDRYGLIMKTDDPLAQLDTINVDQLKALDLIVPQRSFIGHQTLDTFGLDYSLLHVVATYNLILNVTHLVKAGMGYALCIDHLIDTTDSGLTFRPIEPIMHLPLYLVTRKRFALSPLASAVVETIRTMVKTRKENVNRQDLIFKSR